MGSQPEDTRMLYTVNYCLTGSNRKASEFSTKKYEPSTPEGMNGLFQIKIWMSTAVQDCCTIEDYLGIRAGKERNKTK